jgi:ABC-2 type transport system permease protein
MMEREDFSHFRCFWTLFKKEILRFFQVSGQTLVAPLITASLYLLIFGVNLGQKLSIFEHITYLQFIIPGLILMGVVNNSFANTSTSLFVSRYLGNIADLLVTPITPPQMILAYTTAAMIRGIMVGVVIWLVSLIFSGLPWTHPGQAAIMILLSSFLFSQFGIVAAVFAKNFETMAMFTNFIILPLVYLGGLFFPVQQLPSPWNEISHLNPLFYLIEGFRSAVCGIEGLPFQTCLMVAATLSICLCAWAYHLLKTKLIAA